MRRAAGRSTITRLATLSATALIWFFVTASSMQAQESLADQARRAREEHAAQKQQQPAASSETKQLTKQLEAAQDLEASAPAGLKVYSDPKYRLLIPVNSTLEGRDYQGTVLTLTALNGIHALLLAGNPIPLRGNSPRQELLEASMGFNDAISVERTFTSLNKKMAVATRVRGVKFGIEFDAKGYFVLAEDSIIPVVCGTTEKRNEHLIYGNPRSTFVQKKEAYAQQAQRFTNEINGYNLCQTVFNSLRLREDERDSNQTVARDIVPKARTATIAGLHDSAAQPGTGTSLADLAHREQQRRKTEPKASTVIETAAEMGRPPAGFKFHEILVCPECPLGSILVPSDAQVEEEYAGQFVYYLKDGKEIAMRFFIGPLAIGGRMWSDPANIRWWEILSHPLDKPAYAEILDQEPTRIDGRNAVATRFRLVKGGRSSLGHRVNLETQGRAFIVACLASDAKFVELESVCSTVIGSIRLP